MKKYYLNDGLNNIGPFDITELKDQNLNKNSQVWYDGLEEWTTAGELDELKSIIVSTPPPIKKNIVKPKLPNEEKKTGKISEDKITSKKSNWFWRFVKWVAIVLALIAIVIVIANYYQKNNSSPTYEESIMTIAETEAAYPLNYLDAGGTYNQNFLGDKLKINGFITNDATVTTYKDVVIEITFYSKTKTKIGTENYTIYEFFPPNSKKPFNLKINNYSNVKEIGWQVIKASVK